jgi:hypothetical protein
MGLSTLIKLGKTAIEGKKALDSFDQHNATKLGKKAATAPLRAWENIPRWVLRGLQLLVALVAIGFYGRRVDADRRAGDPQAPEWVYGVTIGGLSAITAVAFSVVGALSAVSDRCRTYRLFAWDAMLFLLWIVIFGVTGSIFLSRDDGAPDYKGASTRTMKGVTWLDLVSALLWLISAVYGAIKTFVGRKVDGVTGRVAGKLFGPNKAPASKEGGFYEV